MIKATYLDHMGSDTTVVNAARVSFDKQVEAMSPRDEKLIDYLARHSHWTPFAHPQVQILEEVPIFVARQRFKHTVGFVYNEVSRRYVDDEPAFHYPTKWRSRPSGSVKQGSGDDMDFPGVNYFEAIAKCGRVYQELLDEGVAPEQARMVLPQSMMTKYWVTGSLYAWANAYNLRADAHAQKEIRVLAHQWNDIINPLYPVSWSALTANKGDDK